MSRSPATGRLHRAAVFARRLLKVGLLEERGAASNRRGTTAAVSARITQIFGARRAA